MKPKVKHAYGQEWDVFIDAQKVGRFYFLREWLHGHPRTSGTFIDLRKNKEIDLCRFSYFLDVKEFVISYFQS